MTPPSGATDLAQTTFSLSGVTADTSKTVTMTQSVPFSGVLRDRAGAPVPGANFGISGNGISASTTTNASGQFSVSVLPGTYDFNFQGYGSAAKVPKGYWYINSRVTIPAGGRTGFAVTAPGVAVDVTAVGPAGNPIPNASLRATGSNAAVLFPGDIQGNAYYSESLATTGADGHANLIIFPVGGTGTSVPPANTGLPSAAFNLSGYTTDSSLVISYQQSATNTTPPAITCAAALRRAGARRTCRAPAPPARPPPGWPSPAPTPASA